MISENNNNKIRVMVVDDSAVIRGMVRMLLEKEHDIQIVHSSGNGQSAIQDLKKGSVDVIVLDIEMPVMNGLEAIPELLKVEPHVKIIMSSTLTQRNASISMEAIQLGAADYIPKPTTTKDMASADHFKRDLIDKIRAFGHISRKNKGLKTVSKEEAVSTEPQKIEAKPLTKDIPLKAVSKTIRPDIIAIGSSTGGPQALFEVLKPLKGYIKQPIVITQHMPPTFTTILAEHISKNTGIPAREVSDGDILQPGNIYLARGDYHMVFEKTAQGIVTKLSSDAPENFCRPAVDVMIRSLATMVPAEKILAVILTGMGHDGKSSCINLAQAGGRVIAQDEASSVVWGMPGAVAMAGICSDVLPLKEIPQKIKEIANL